MGTPGASCCKAWRTAAIAAARLAVRTVRNCSRNVNCRVEKYSAGSTGCPNGALRTSFTTPITSYRVGGLWAGRVGAGAPGGRGRTRTRFSPSGPIPPVMLVITRPVARRSGKKRAANVSLTTTTPAESISSLAANARPAAMVAPIDSK